MNKGILETRKVNNSRVRGREMGLMNFVGIFESRRCTARCTARCGLGIVNNNPPSHSRRRALSTNSTSISRFDSITAYQLFITVLPTMEPESNKMSSKELQLIEELNKMRLEQLQIIQDWEEELAKIAMVEKVSGPSATSNIELTHQTRRRRMSSPKSSPRTSSRNVCLTSSTV